MAPVEVQVCRFGDDDKIGPKFFLMDEVLPVEAFAVFLHDCKGKVERQFFVQMEFAYKSGGRNHCSKPPLLIGRPAAKNLAVFHFWLEGVE